MYENYFQEIVEIRKIRIFTCETNTPSTNTIVLLWMKVQQGQISLGILQPTIFLLVGIIFPYYRRMFLDKYALLKL